MSRRRPQRVRAWDPDQQVEHGARLPRGYGKPVERWAGRTFLAELDVTCGGEPGRGCGQRLGQLSCTERPAGIDDVIVPYADFAGYDPGDMYDGGAIVGLYVLCPCGEHSEIDLRVVARLLASMVDQSKRVLRMSSDRLAALA